MPAMSSRMSISSSTTRISDETCDPFCFMHHPLFWFGWPPQRKHHTHGRAARFARLILGGVFQQQFPPVVFENLAHDGKTEPRAFGARRDIGLGEAVAVLRRQADAMVVNRSDEPRAFDAQIDRAAAGRRIAAR